MSSAPTPAPGTPTPAQVAQVQQNIQNLQHLNDAVYTDGYTLFGNAFGLLSLQDNSDLGVTVGVSVMQGVVAGLGAPLGPGGAVAATFLCGMLSSWISSPPSHLAETFGGLEKRLMGMTIALDHQLAKYYHDVAKHWNDSFSYNGASVTLAQLAEPGTVPAETDPKYAGVLKAGNFALDQWIWRSLLREKYFVTSFDDVGWGLGSLDQNDPPVSVVQAYYLKNPAYYLTWYWVALNNPGQGWNFPGANLGTGVTPGFNSFDPLAKDGGLNIPACNYLFIDSTPGTIINSAGLFTREEVFTGLGIPTAQHNSAPPGL